MKTLEKYAKENGLTLHPINYKAQGIKIKRKGWDLVNSEGHIIAGFEPINYRNGDKWRVNNVHTEYKGKDSFPRITKEVLAKFNPKAVTY